MRHSEAYTALPGSFIEFRNRSAHVVDGERYEIPADAWLLYAAYCEWSGTDGVSHYKCSTAAERLCWEERKVKRYRRILRESVGPDGRPLIETFRPPGWRTWHVRVVARERTRTVKRSPRRTRKVQAADLRLSVKDGFVTVYPPNGQPVTLARETPQGAVEPAPRPRYGPRRYHDAHGRLRPSVFLAVVAALADARDVAGESSPARLGPAGDPTDVTQGDHIVDPRAPDPPYRQVSNLHPLPPPCGVGAPAGPNRAGEDSPATSRDRQGGNDERPGPVGNGGGRRQPPPPEWFAALRGMLQ